MMSSPEALPENSEVGFHGQRRNIARGSSANLFSNLSSRKVLALKDALVKDQNVRVWAVSSEEAHRSNLPLRQFILLSKSV